MGRGRAGASATGGVHGARRVGQGILAASLLVGVVGCTSKEAATYRQQRDSLRVVLTETQGRLEAMARGPDRLLVVARRLESSGAWRLAADTAQLLLARFPQAPEARTADSLRARVTVALAKADAARTDSLASDAAAASARRANAVAGLIRVRDDVLGRTTYYPRYAGQYVNGRSALLLSLIHPDGSEPRVHLEIRYVADRWLFVQRYVVKVDGQTFMIDASGHKAVDTDFHDGKIFEWYSAEYQSAEEQIVEAVMAGKSATLRYLGRQYHQDRTITAAEKADLRRVLDAADALRAHR